MEFKQYKYSELKMMKEEFEEALLKREYKDLSFYKEIMATMQEYRSNRFAYAFSEEELGVVKNVYRLAVQVVNKLEGK